MVLCKNALVAVVTVTGIAGVTAVSVASLVTGHNHVIEAYGAVTGLATLGASAISHFVKDGETGKNPNNSSGGSI